MCMFSIFAQLHGSLNPWTTCAFHPILHLYHTWSACSAVPTPLLFPDLLPSAQNQRITEWFRLEAEAINI